MRSIAMILLLSACLPSAAARAAIKVVTTTTNLAFAVREVGGGEVEVEALLAGTEDPHFVDASPRFVHKVASADVVCIVGLDLEVGWMPKVLARAGNAKVQSGGKGYCDASKAISPLDKPAGPIDRSMGDVHAGGNPHYDLSPLRLAEAARAIKDALAETAPAKAEFFQANFARFEARMRDLHASMKKRLLAALPRPDTVPVIEYHGEFKYFLTDYGLKSAGAIEETPGVPPSAGRIAEVGLSAKKTGVKAALSTLHHPQKIMERFTEISGVPALALPIYVQAKGEPDNYEKLQQRLIDAIAFATKGK